MFFSLFSFKHACLVSRPVQLFSVEFAYGILWHTVFVYVLWCSYHIIYVEILLDLFGSCSVSEDILRYLKVKVCQRYILPPFSRRDRQMFFLPALWMQLEALKTMRQTSMGLGHVGAIWWDSMQQMGRRNAKKSYDIISYNIWYYHVIPCAYIILYYVLCGDQQNLTDRVQTWVVKDMDVEWCRSKSQKCNQSPSTSYCGLSGPRICPPQKCLLTFSIHSIT